MTNRRDLFVCAYLDGRAAEPGAGRNPYAGQSLAAAKMFRLGYQAMLAERWEARMRARAVGGLGVRSSTYLPRRSAGTPKTCPELRLYGARYWD